MSRKQEIYQRMLEMSIPYMRSTLSPLRGGSLMAVVKRMRGRDAVEYVFEVGQFVHGVTPVLFEEEFTAHDLWFLNTNAQVFYRSPIAAECPLYPPFVGFIAELFALVPESMREKLKWEGPGDYKAPVEYTYRAGEPNPTT